jgi:hypothetical protein
VAEEAEFRVSPNKEKVLLVMRKGETSPNPEDGVATFEEHTEELPIPAKR